VHKFACLVMLATLASAASIASRPAAAAPPQDHPPASAHSAPLIPAAPPDAVTHHNLVLDGKTLHYTARVGQITLYDDERHPTARMSYVAYTLDGANPSDRPVTFFYNGGPGSSTVWLHMGSFAPVRLLAPDAHVPPPPPYRMTMNNPYSLLDVTDEVFVDAPSTGFGRLIGAGKPKDFFGVDQDARAFAQFIQTYITTFGRWNSPKFLFGESYGTTRSAVVAAVLQEQGIQLNGIVLLSSILNFALDWGTNFSPTDIGGGDWAYVLYLPSEAATAWYHHALPDRPAHLRPFLEQVQHFALTEYLQALADGSTLSPSVRADVVRKLHEYTGLSERYIENSNLRWPYWRFENELLRNQGKIVGRLDSRYETGTLDREAESPPWDPADVAMTPIFTALFNEYVRQTLDYHPTVPYRIVNYGQELRNWDFKHHGVEPTNVAPDLAETMVQNPHLRVFSANGYYDFATPYFATVYTLEHLNLSPSLQRNITFGFYESGHMVYMNEAALRQFHDDLERWYRSVLTQR
jgi:carboxypeptidase C (cathepsin A)